MDSVDVDIPSNSDFIPNSGSDTETMILTGDHSSDCFNSSFVLTHGSMYILFPTS